MVRDFAPFSILLGLDEGVILRSCQELPQSRFRLSALPLYPLILADVLQPLHPDIRDADMVGHQVCSDEHLVLPAGLVCHHSIAESIVDVRSVISGHHFIVNGLIRLRHGHDLTGLKGRELQQSIFLGNRVESVCVIFMAIRKCSPMNLRRYDSPRHRLPTFHHGFREAVAVIEHYLFHIQIALSL